MASNPAPKITDTLHCNLCNLTRLDEWMRLARYKPIVRFGAETWRFQTTRSIYTCALKAHACKHERKKYRFLWAKSVETPFLARNSQYYFWQDCLLKCKLASVPLPRFLQESS